ncbi:MAG: hypothetical protein QM767_09945 [Anaeromyxobacter sp.]
MNYLDVARDNLAFRLDELLRHLGTVARVEVRAAAVDGIAEHYRQLAIAELLAEADTGAFFRDLCASGLAQAAVLEEVRWDQVMDFQYLCASRCRPFHDAVAAGDEETAIRIARASRPGWSREDETEPEYLRAQLLLALVAPDRPAAPAADALLVRLEELSDPADDPRTAACLALHRRDADGFDPRIRSGSCRARPPPCWWWSAGAPPSGAGHRCWRRSGAPPSSASRSTGWPPTPRPPSRCAPRWRRRWRRPRCRPPGSSARSTATVGGRASGGWR